MGTLQEFDEILKEATMQVEQALSLEDSGWINLSALTSNIIPADQRKTTVQEARLYSLKDPLASRAVHLMTDYSFGSGITWNAEDKNADKALSGFWYAPANQALFSAKGQRKSSDKLLIDGEIFLAVFLGPNGQATIRRINPLEITEFVTDPDDLENVRFYKREWSDTHGIPHISLYRSFQNIKNEPCRDSLWATVQKTDDALVYHLAINDLGQRGNSYLFPVLEWVKLYRKFLASRVAIVLALAIFVMKLKLAGGQTAVDAAKGKLHEQQIKSGSTWIENAGAELSQIKTDSGAGQAQQDGRMLKLQISAGTGWPEQYFGDISIGNLATAKTVELPVQKMCESYQSIWQGALEDIFDLVLEHNDIPEDKRYIDIDFPKVSEEAAASIAQSLSLISQVFPEFANSDDVKQIALMALGVNNVSEVLDKLKEIAKSDPNVILAKALRLFRESLKKEDK